MKDTILVTLGDPNGLGPELVCRWLAARPEIKERIVIIGLRAALSHHAGRLGLGAPWRRIGRMGLSLLSADGAQEGACERSEMVIGWADPGRAGSRGAAKDACPDATAPSDLASLPAGSYLLEPEGLETFTPEPGRFSASGGLAAGLSLNLACDLLLSGRASALVTCPLNKAGLQAAGFDFPGHTEFLAKRAGLGPEDVCMHLCGPKLRVSLVTTHPALRDVPRLVTEEKVLRCLKLTVQHVRRLGLFGPVAVCGLNPHAGESGRIGDEEARIIEPALEKARSLGLDVAGPFPADTVFRRAYKGEFPAVLAMYHDQGLAPLKLVHFGEAVNVTLGLPFIRTSVDHGTGYDLVGQDTADMGSFLAALDLARRLAKRQG